MADKVCRCGWSEEDELLRAYHDGEWGVPQHDDLKLFEHLLMESMSCGLSWLLMLKKRDVFARCFDGFDPALVARYGEADVLRIMGDPEMIHSERKVRAVIGNAGRFLEMAEKFGSFDRYIWSFTGGKTVVYRSSAVRRLTRSALSEAVSRDMKKRGFRFVGAVSVFSFLEACGMVNDHVPSCFRREEVARMNSCVVLDDVDCELKL